MRTVDSFWKTYPPVVKQDTGNLEALKYGKLWEFPEYRVISPGQDWVPTFLTHANPRKGSRIIDLGCGTGRAGLLLHTLGMNVILVDFVRNCLDPEVKEKLGDKFVKADLEKKLPIIGDYGYCCDVMEHIPPDKVDIVLQNVLMAAQYVFFSVSTDDDEAGVLIGEKLHLSVNPYSWWADKFKSLDVKILWSEKCSNCACFLVTAWQDGQDVVDSGRLNESEDAIKENVKFNCSQGWNQVVPHETNEIECMIVGGGPTLDDFLDEIKQMRIDGVKLLTLNGAYNWCLERGLTPSAQIMVDARPFNARFVYPVVEDCRYLIASQCHPSVLEGLPKDRTFIWHTTTELIEDILKENYGFYWPVPGGSTVLLRAIPLMRMLGYHKFHLYGCDSCINEKGEHHAYEQKENDSEVILPVNLGGKSFHCMPWMASQATEFISLVQYIGNEVELEVHGNGLLAWIIEYASSLSDDEELSLEIS